MNTVTLIGIDLGKHCFHVHGQDAQGRMIFRKKLSRNQMLMQPANVPVCRVVMEACAGHAGLPGAYLRWGTKRNCFRRSL